MILKVKYNNKINKERDYINFMEFDKEDKKVFLRTLNKKGFILEDKVWKIFHNHLHLTRIERGLIPKMHFGNFNERIEIDLVATIENKQFIVECKHTDYAWVFPKSLDRPNTINLINTYGEGASAKSRSTSDFKVVFSDIAISLEGKKIVKQRGSKLALTSYKDIHEHIRQILKNLEAFISEGIETKNHIFIPLIVTNAPLYYLDYEEKNLNDNGDLEDYTSIKEVPFILYNFSEMLNLEIPEEEPQMKSIFIVNINKLGELIPLILDQTIGGGRDFPNRVI